MQEKGEIDYLHHIYSGFQYMNKWARCIICCSNSVCKELLKDFAAVSVCEELFKDFAAVTVCVCVCVRNYVWTLLQ